MTPDEIANTPPHGKPFAVDLTPTMLLRLCPADARTDRGPFIQARDSEFSEVGDYMLEQYWTRSDGGGEWLPVDVATPEKPQG